MYVAVYCFHPLSGEEADGDVQHWCVPRCGGYSGGVAHLRDRHPRSWCDANGQEASVALGRSYSKPAHDNLL